MAKLQAEKIKISWTGRSVATTTSSGWGAIFPDRQHGDSEMLMSHAIIGMSDIRFDLDTLLNAECKLIEAADSDYSELVLLLPQANPGWEIKTIFSFWNDSNSRYLISLKHSSSETSFWVSDNQGNLLGKSELDLIYDLIALDCSFLFHSCCSKQGILPLNLVKAKSRLLSLLLIEVIQDKDFLPILFDHIDLSILSLAYEALDQQPAWLKSICDKELVESSGHEIRKSFVQCSDIRKVFMPFGNTGYEQLITTFSESGSMNYSVIITGCMPSSCQAACFFEYETCSLRIYRTAMSPESLIVTLIASMLVYAIRINDEDTSICASSNSNDIRAGVTPTLLMLSNHVGHQIWFEASAVAHCAEPLTEGKDSEVTKLNAIIPESHQQFLDYKALFSRDGLSGLSTVSYAFSWPQCLEYWIRYPKLSMLVSRQTKVPKILADRVKEYYTAPLDSSVFQDSKRTELSATPSKAVDQYIVLNIRSGNRMPTNQLEILQAISNYILEHTNFSLAFTGLNRGGGVAFSSKGNLQLLEYELGLVNDITSILPSPFRPRVLSLIGSDISNEFEILASSAILAIAPWGAGLAKLAWALRIPLIIYGNKQVLDHTYGDWDIYTSTAIVENPSINRFLPPEFVENVRQLPESGPGDLPNYREDYCIQSEGILKIIYLITEMLCLTSKHHENS